MAEQHNRLHRTCNLAVVTSARDHDVGNQSGTAVSDVGPRFCFPPARQANAVEEILKSDRNTNPDCVDGNKLIGT